MPDWLGLKALAAKHRVDRENEKMAAVGYPPKPPTMPAVTPTADLKNRTALGNQYSDEAARELYNTPVKMRVREPQRPQWSGDVGHVDWGQGAMVGEEETRAAYYKHKDEWGRTPKPQIVIEHMPGISDGGLKNAMTGHSGLEFGEDLLAHEFAHKWDFEKMPKQTHEDWSGEFTNVVHPDIALWSMSRQLDGTGSAGPEAYAHQAELGPHALTPEQRDTWYTGLYRDDIKSPPAFPQAEHGFGPDLKAMRESYFSPQQWVPEQRAPHGYYADGTPKPTFPTWNPGFSIHDYAPGMGMRGG
jgi:hypothetical protein